jgi:hypothetical protein
MIVTKQQLTISISTINDTDYLGKGISIYFFCLLFSDCSAGMVEGGVWCAFVGAFKALTSRVL